MKYLFALSLLLWTPFCNGKTLPISKELQMRIPPAFSEGCLKSFSTYPYVCPRLVQKLDGVVLNGYESPCVSFDFIDDQQFGGKNSRKFITYPEDDRSFFRYEYIGKTDHGVYVLLTRDCGGGSGVFMNFVFFTFEKDKVYGEGGIRERVVMKKVGSFYLGDRWSGTAEMKENILCVHNAWSVGTETEYDEVIDLSPLKPSTLSPPDTNDLALWNGLHAALDYPPLYEDLGALLKLGNDINQTNEKGQTPLMVAADMWGDEAQSAALFLLEKGADPHLLDDHDRSILHYAIDIYSESTSPLITALIEKGVDIHQRDKEGLNSLDIALSTRKKELANDLFKKGVRPSPASIEYAVWLDHFDALKYLLDQGAEIDGDFLRSAASHKNLAIVKLLLEKGANPNHMTNWGSPLDAAIDKNWEEGISFLRKAGGKTSTELEETIQK